MSVLYIWGFQWLRISDDSVLNSFLTLKWYFQPLGWLLWYENSRMNMFYQTTPTFRCRGRMLVAPEQTRLDNSTWEDCSELRERDPGTLVIGLHKNTMLYTSLLPIFNIKYIFFLSVIKLNSLLITARWLFKLNKYYD